MNPTQLLNAVQGEKSKSYRSVLVGKGPVGAGPSSVKMMDEEHVGLVAGKRLSSTW